MVHCCDRISDQEHTHDKHDPHKNNRHKQEDPREFFVSFLAEVIQEHDPQECESELR